MRLDMCMLADAATGTPDGKLFVHGGGITRIAPPVLPWLQPMIAVVIRLQFDPEDFARDHAIDIRLTSPSGDAVLDPPPNLKVSAGPVPDHVEGEELFVQVALGLGHLRCETAGIYRFAVVVDGELVRELPVAVIAPKAPGSRPTQEGQPVARIKPGRRAEV